MTAPIRPRHRDTTDLVHSFVDDRDNNDFVVGQYGKSNQDDRLAAELSHLPDDVLIIRLRALRAQGRPAWQLQNLLIKALKTRGARPASKSIVADAERLWRLAFPKEKFATVRYLPSNSAAAKGVVARSTSGQPKHKPMKIPAAGTPLEGRARAALQRAQLTANGHANAFAEQAEIDKLEGIAALQPWNFDSFARQEKGRAKLGQATRRQMLRDMPQNGYDVSVYLPELENLIRSSQERLQQIDDDVAALTVYQKQLAVWSEQETRSPSEVAALAQRVDQLSDEHPGRVVHQRYERQRLSGLMTDLGNVQAGLLPMYMLFADRGAVPVTKPGKRPGLGTQLAYNFNSGVLAGGGFLARAIDTLAHWSLPPGEIQTREESRIKWALDQIGLPEPPRPFAKAADWLDKLSGEAAEVATGGAEANELDYSVRGAGYLLEIAAPMALLGRARLPGMSAQVTRPLSFFAAGAAGHSNRSTPAMLEAGLVFSLVPLTGQMGSPLLRVPASTLIGPVHTYLNTIDWPAVLAAIDAGEPAQALTVVKETGNHAAARAAGINGLLFSLGGEVVRAGSAKASAREHRGNSRSAPVREPDGFTAREMDDLDALLAAIANESDGGSSAPLLSGQNSSGGGGGIGGTTVSGTGGAAAFVGGRGSGVGVVASPVVSTGVTHASASAQASSLPVLETAASAATLPRGQWLSNVGLIPGQERVRPVAPPPLLGPGQVYRYGNDGQIIGVLDTKTGKTDWLAPSFANAAKDQPHAVQSSSSERGNDANAPSSQKPNEDEILLKLIPAAVASGDFAVAPTVKIKSPVIIQKYFEGQTYASSPSAEDRRFGYSFKVKDKWVTAYWQWDGRAKLVEVSLAPQAIVEVLEQQLGDTAVETKTPDVPSIVLEKIRTDIGNDKAYITPRVQQLLATEFAVNSFAIFAAMKSNEATTTDWVGEDLVNPAIEVYIYIAERGWFYTRWTTREKPLEGFTQTSRLIVMNVAETHNANYLHDRYPHLPVVEPSSWQNKPAVPETGRFGLVFRSDASSTSAKAPQPQQNLQSTRPAAQPPTTRRSQPATPAPQTARQEKETKLPSPANKNESALSVFVPPKQSAPAKPVDHESNKALFGDVIEPAIRLGKFDIGDTAKRSIAGLTGLGPIEMKLQIPTAPCHRVLATKDDVCNVLLRLGEHWLFTEWQWVEFKRRAELRNPKPASEDQIAALGDHKFDEPLVAAPGVMRKMTGTGIGYSDGKKHSKAELVARIEEDYARNRVDMEDPIAKTLRGWKDLITIDDIRKVAALLANGSQSQKDKLAFRWPQTPDGPFQLSGTFAVVGGDTDAPVDIRVQVAWDVWVDEDKGRTRLTLIKLERLRGTPGRRH